MCWSGPLNRAASSNAGITIEMSGFIKGKRLILEASVGNVNLPKFSESPANPAKPSRQLSYDIVLLFKGLAL